MKAKDIVSGEVRKNSSGGASDDLDVPILMGDLVLEIRHICVENKSNDYTRLVIGVSDGIIFYEKEEQDSPKANNLYWSKSLILIPPGRYLKARLTGCTLGDQIKMSYEGILYDRN